MTDSSGNQTIQMRVSEPESEERLYEGVAIGTVHVDDRSYLLVAVDNNRSWIILGPRYGGDSIQQILEGNRIIVNVGRPRESTGDFPSVGDQLESRSVEFFGIGSAVLVER